MTPQAPNITAGAAGYTANNSWFAGLGRSASITGVRLKYKLALAYADMNISFYRELGTLGEKEFRFNAKTIPAYINLGKLLKNPRWLIGAQYIFLHTRLKMQDGSDLPDFVKETEVNSSIGEAGIVGEYDSRDNIFTPDRGIKAHTHLNFSESFFGSDCKYQGLNSFIYWYYPFRQNQFTGRNRISALRFDFQQMFGDPPFYIIPSISLRGMPVARYQGKTNILLESEQRWDFVHRWSLVFYGGLAKAFDHYSDFSDAELLYSYGTGLRYLVARKFNLRMGVDLAKGPENLAYYIVFGSYWAK